jgi:hypothetical protein
MAAMSSRVSADERAAMGHLLYLIVERNRPSTGLMISALVTHLNASATNIQVSSKIAQYPQACH